MKNNCKLVFLAFLATSIVGCGGKGGISSPVLSGPEKMEDAYIGQTVTLPAVTASDRNDGDITRKIVASVKDPNKTDVEVANQEFVASVLGTYYVTFAVANSKGAKSSLDYHFECKDYTLSISLEEESGTCYAGVPFEVPSASASDPINGDLSDKVTYVVKDSDNVEIVVSEGKFTPEVGTYTITYSVDNLLGKKASIDYVLTAKSNTPTIVPFTISNKYVNEIITLPTAEVDDPLSSQFTFEVEIEDPAHVKTDVSEDYEYTPTAAGTYTAYYTATNQYGHVAEYNTSFEVKEKLVIGWDQRMYTKGVSALTPTIMNTYITYVKSELSDSYENVNIELKGFSNVEATSEDCMAKDMKAADVEISVGFSSSTIGEGETKIAAIENNKCKIAEITERYIARHSESDLAKAIYNASITENGIKSLEVKKINVAWFDNGNNALSPEPLRNAADQALEAYFTGLGYTIDVQSHLYTKPSGTSYQDVKDAIINDECVFGINWAGNFNLDSGFMFKYSRVKGTFSIQGKTGRYVTGMVKADDNRVFYNNTFEYLYSETMLAIYAATY